MRHPGDLLHTATPLVLQGSGAPAPPSSPWNFLMGPCLCELRHMVRIGLLSDTHGWLDPRLRHHFEACDAIWHAGDIGSMEVADTLEQWAPLRAVWGNIDDAALRRRFAEHQRFEAEGLRVWMTHIGGRPPRYDRAVAEELRRDPPGLFICGHSHILLVRHDASLGLLHMNPGAAGRQGWHTVRTALRFTIAQGSVRDLEVIELGPRAAKVP